MELLAKVLLATLLVVVVLGVCFYALKGIFTLTVTKAQAESLIMSDLQNAVPDSVLNVTNATPSTYAGSWHIIVSVVANATTPCPSYYILAFDYPKYGFESTVVNTYTSNCNIYEASNGSAYIVSSYPVAITKSYILGIPQVTSFVNQYGFHNVSVSATPYNTTQLEGQTYNDVWVVTYAAPKANHDVVVVLTQASGAEETAYNETTMTT